MRRLLVRNASMLDLLALASAAALAASAALIWRHTDRLLPIFASGSHTHLASSHDPALVILSVAISVFASYTALDLTGRAHASEGGIRASWLAAGAVAMGGGIWSMHFVAMLAFDLGMPVSYDARLILLSFLVAVAVTGVGLSAVIGGGGKLTGVFLGGVFMGLGVASMHYTGMAAMRAGATIAYDPVLFVLSVLIAIAASVAALWLAFKLRAFWHKAAAAVVMGAAICGMHYTAMAAALYTPTALVPVDGDPGIPRELLAAITAGSSFTLLSFGLIWSLVDQHFAARVAQERLRESEERLRLLIEGVHDYAILMLDPEGRIASWNAGAERLKGWREEEILGSPAAVLHRPEEAAKDKPDEELRIAREAGRFEGEGWRVRKDGTAFLAHISLRPLYGPQGQLRGYTEVTRDITEPKRVEEHQRLLMTELDHRVRNTLAAVQSMARQTLGEGERVGTFLARLAAFAQTHTLLAQGRWRGAGLRALVGAALEAYDGRVHLDGPDVLLQPRATQALGMVLHELATNAAKYGAWSMPEGRVAVRWRVRAGDPRRLVLEWTEQGGPPVKPPCRRGFGTLLVERSLAHEINGSAELDFRPEGLRCAIELPLTGKMLAEPTPQGATTSEAAPQTSDMSALAGRRILLVEDMLLAALELDDLLRSAGIETVGPAARLEQALALAERERLDGAVLDINLDGQMVFPVAEMLRRRDVPFVFLTGYDSGTALPREFRSERRVIKPVRLEELKITLADALTRAPARVIESQNVG
jgi:PAS domain S-box-containing protein